MYFNNNGMAETNENELLHNVDILKRVRWVVVNITRKKMYLSNIDQT